VVVDFVPEAGVLTNDVLNRVYFQTFTNDARSDIIDFKNATLVASKKV
jgi:hypothetical protein